MIRAGDEKDDLFTEYKENVEKIPCKHFNQGKGYCPFRNSCFYAHNLPDGTKYVYPYKASKINANGEWEDDEEEITLANRIGNGLF